MHIADFDIGMLGANAPACDEDGMGIDPEVEADIEKLTLSVLPFFKTVPSARVMLAVLPGRALVFMRRLRDLVRDPLSHNADLEPLDVFEV
mgnify:CR=1 FL=1